MSTPVRGGPRGPLGYAPRRTREQGGPAGSEPPAENDPPRADNPPPHAVSGAADGGDRTPSLREALRDGLLSPGDAPSSLRQALSDHGDDLTERLDSLSAPRRVEPARIEPAPRTEPARESAPRRGQPEQMREALSALERLTSRSAQLLRESQDAPRPLPPIDPPVRAPERVRETLRDTLSGGVPLITEADLLPPGKPRVILPPLAPEPPTQEPPVRALPEPLTKAPPAPDPQDQPPRAKRPAAKAPPVKAPPVKPAGAPRDLLDDGFDIEPPPRPRKEDRRRAVEAPLVRQQPARTPPPRQPTRQGSSDVFAGDAAMVALRSRLAGDAEEDFEPPPPVRTARLSLLTRFVGVVALAAGGALGFLWITSPRERAPAPVITDEVALVDLKAAAPEAALRAPAIAAAPTSDAAGNDGAAPDLAAQTPQALAPVVTYNNDAAAKAAPAPAVPQTRAGGPRVVTITPAPSAALELVAPSAPPAGTDPAPAATAAPPSLGPAPGASDLLARATDLLQHGDVAAARLVLRRAAASDNAQAALALAGTYDTRVLKKLGITTFNDADPVQARDWYRKAAALGSADASARLEQMERDHARQ